MKLFDGFFGVTATTHPDAIQAVAFGVIALRDGKRQSVFDDDRITADERFAPDAAKLMNARIRADICAVFNRHVTGERGSVCHYHFVADAAVVGDMRLRHQQIIVADFGQNRRRPPFPR